MKKKLLTLLVALTVSAAANAQFEQGKMYAGASLSGLDLGFDSTNKLSLGVRGKVGYFLIDDWMVTADVDYHKQHDVPHTLSVGAGGRYYIEQNGIYIGASLKYVHYNKTHDDLMPSVQVGYAYFISRTVTIEPEIYYNQSTKSHSDYSGVGFRLGFGIYL